MVVLGHARPAGGVEAVGRPAREFLAGVVGLAVVDVVGTVGAGVGGLPVVAGRGDDALLGSVRVPDQELGLEGQRVAVGRVVGAVLGDTAVVPAVAEHGGEGDLALVRLARDQVRDVVGEVVDGAVVVGPARGQELVGGAVALRYGDPMAVDVRLVQAEGGDVEPGGAYLTSRQSGLSAQERGAGGVGPLARHGDPPGAVPAGDAVGGEQAGLEACGRGGGGGAAGLVPDRDRPVVAGGRAQGGAAVAYGDRSR